MGLIGIQMIVRDEPLAHLALRSVMCREEVSSAVVIDTGSTDGTRERLREEAALIGDRVRVRSLEMPDATRWTYEDTQQWSWFPCAELHQIVAAMLPEPYIWIVDGDEIYRTVSVDRIIAFVRQWPSTTDCGFLPLAWFSAYDQRVVKANPEVGGFTGRLFRKHGRKVKGDFPHEQAWYDGKVAQMGASNVSVLDDVPQFHHYEPMLKPWRRKLIETEKYTGAHPEVMMDFKPVEQ